ncbi:MAG: cytochrome c family protein [Thermodesulfovibrio sp.]|nr:cytochrome c family protein [Thermodesulfovibrio sp.]
MKFFLTVLLVLFFPLAAFSDYVGIEACKPCHQKQYENFIKFSRMSNSFIGVEKMKNKITPEELKGCYECHTTGYGKKGGFVSVDKTPHLKNTGCEVCHGPGKKHVETKKPQYIKGKLTPKICEPCHTEERIRTFRFRPLLRGAH